MPIEDIKTKEGTSTRFVFPVPITGTNAAMADTNPPEAILPGVAWRGMTTLLSGAPKSGKSTLIRDWIRRIGKARFSVNLHHQFVLKDRLVRSANVLYFSEESPYAWNAFFQEMQADKVCFAARSSTGENQSDFDWFKLFDRRHSGIAPIRPDERKYWVDAVIEVVKAFEIDLVIVDPITRFLALTSENDNSEVLSAMIETERIATEGNCALLMLHHTGKAGGQARGASAFLQNADAILTLRKPKEGEEVPEAPDQDSVRILEGVGRFDEIEPKIGLWFDGAEYFGTDRVSSTGKVRRLQEDDSDLILVFVKRNAPIEASLESSNWEGFSKEEIETGTKITGSRFQRAMRTLVSKNAITRYGNTRKTRYKLT